MSRTSLTVAPAARFPPFYRPPVVSKPLREAIFWQQRGVGEYHLGAAHRAEAIAAADAMQPPCMPAGEQTANAWLLALNFALDAPLNRESFALRGGAVARAISDLPMLVFTGETLAEASRTFQFFPGAAAVSKLLEPKARSVLSLRRDLMIVAGIPEPARPNRPATDDEVVAVLANFRPRFAAVMEPARAAAALAAPAPKAPRPVNPAVLQEQYRREMAVEKDPRRRQALEARLAHMGGSDVA
jgi:hypothetical protein